jgi:hypothetical protein
MGSTVRVCAVTAIAVLLAGNAARAQTTNAPAAAAEDGRAWSFSASAFTYILSDGGNYVQPTVSADRGRLHLEARYNYENLETGSAWLGVNFGGGKTLEWAFTPMLGGVFGDTYGIAPGFAVSLGWRKLELSSENEYVVDLGERADSFFYNWSEVTLAPADSFRFGVVTQRTRVYQTDREIHRGLMAGFSVKQVNFTGYVFNPDEDKPRFVFAVDVTF